MGSIVYAYTLFISTYILQLFGGVFIGICTYAFLSYFICKDDLIYTISLLRNLVTQKQKHMNIVVCPNNYFTMPCTVLLCSLLENNRDVNYIMIHVLVDGTFQERNKNIIKEQISRYRNASVHFYCIKEDWLKGISIGEASLVQIPIVTFFRLFMSEIFPEEVEKVLYLDSDMIVRKSLKGLYQTNLENKAVAAVIDTFNYKIDIYNNLRYKPALGYFNAGMLLVNLKY